MFVFSQLEAASLENLSADPSSIPLGRIWFDTAQGRTRVVTNTGARSVICNDGKAVFGSSATAIDNIRLHRGGSGLLQFVPGNDTTAEGTMATIIAALSFRHPSFTTTGLPAVGNAGRIVFDSTVLGLKVDTGTVFRQLATLDGVETLSNKTLTAPLADVINITDSGATPATPAAGTTKLYTKAGQVYKLGSDGLETVVGAGSGSGAFNYLSNGDFEAGISTVSWAKTTVTNGQVSGSPTITASQGTSSLVLSTETTAPLRNTKSLRITAGTAWTQGDGIAVGPQFTIQAEDLGKVLTYSLAYQVVSGSANLNFSGLIGSQSLALAIYDITAGAFIGTPAGAYGINAGNIPGVVAATFQTSIVPGQKYQAFLFNVGATSAGPCAVLLDDVQVGPGSLAPDSRTISFVGAQSANQSVTANSTNIAATPTLDRAGAWTGSTYLVPASGDYSISSSVFSSAAGNLQVFLNGTATALIGSSGNNTIVIAGIIPNLKSGDVISLRFQVNATLANVYISINRIGGAASSATEPRVITARRATAAANNGANNTATLISWEVPQFDNASGWISNTTYQIPVTGFYRVSAKILPVNTLAGNNAQLLLYVDGANFTELGYATNAGSGQPLPSLNGSTTVQLNAGQKISLYWSYQNDGNVRAFSQNATQNWVAIERVTGPSAATAAEGVSASYALATATNTAANAPVTFDTKYRDSHNALNAATGTFVAPLSGFYSVSGFMNPTATVNFLFYVDGVARLFAVQAGANGASFASGFYLNANQALTIRPVSAITSGGTVSGAPTVSLHIVKTAN